MTPMLEDEILSLNQRLLDSIVACDWKAYAELCDPSLSAFEPEACGHLVEGLPFHRFYFERGVSKTPCQSIMSSPHVRFLGSEVAVLCYLRLTQFVDPSGYANTKVMEETRVWHRIDGRWRHVHFHRSRPSGL